MITKKVTRHYCEYCRKGKFSRPWMIQHESSCVLNPNRGCCLCGLPKPGYVLSEVIAEMRKRDDVLIDPEPRGFDEDGHYEEDETSKAAIDHLEKLVHDCPLCMLAVVMQAGIWANSVFNYKDKKRDFQIRKEVYPGPFDF